MATVDVVVPCYQHGHFLGDCVTSVLTQDIRDLRLLIVDNASADNSLQVARQLAEDDSRVEVRAHRTNLGHHASFNEGIDWAAAPYFVMLCADDMLAPGCLTRAVSLMDRRPDVAFTYGRSVPVDGIASIAPSNHIDQGRWRFATGRQFIARICGKGLMHIPSSTLVIRTSAQKRTGHYRNALVYLDDLEMWMRLACQGNVAETTSIQGIRMSAGGTRSMSKDAALGGDLLWTEAVIESFFANEGAALAGCAQLHRKARRTLGQRAYWSAVSSLVRGHSEASRDLLQFAVSRCPSCAFLPPVGYLFRKRQAFRRIGQVLLEAACGPHKPVEPARRSN